MFSSLEFQGKEFLEKLMEQEASTKKFEFDWKGPKTVFVFTFAILVTFIVAISILREKIINEDMDITTVIGRGEVLYQPDIAIINLGVQIDKAPKAEEALNKLDESMNKIVSSAKGLGIAEEDIMTQSYSLYPHYDFQGEGGGTSIPSGYDANQQVSIRARMVDENPLIVSKIIEEASKSGANQVVGISFDVSNLEELKQKARLEAIADAREKSVGLAKAAGVKKIGSVVSWYENIIKSPDTQYPYYGLGGSGEKSSVGSGSSPQINPGIQEIIIEMGLSYRIK